MILCRRFLGAELKPSYYRQACLNTGIGSELLPAAHSARVQRTPRAV